MHRNAIFIVRGYNKSAEDFLDFERRFAPIQQSLQTQHIAHRIIYSTPDTSVNIPHMDLPLEVFRIDGSIEKPLWSTGLNTPIQHILDTTPAGKRDTTCIIPYSFETTLNETNAALLARTIASGTRFISHRITPSWLNEYPVNPMQHLQDVAEYIQQGTLQELANDPKNLQTMCMCNRNTLGYYLLSDFSTYGLFNPKTDDLGGMEDWEFTLRVMLQDPTYMHTISSVIEYTDTRIPELKPGQEDIQKQQEKLAREVQALSRIILSLG